MWDLVPHLGIKAGPLRLEHKDLPTRPSGKSLCCLNFKDIYRNVDLTYLISSSPFCPIIMCESHSVLTLFDPLDCVAHKAPLSIKFSRQEYWSLYSLLQVIFQGWNPAESPALQADSLPSEPPGKPMLLLLLLCYYCFTYFIHVCYRTNNTLL